MLASLSSARRRSIGTASLNFRTTLAPPAKSIPQLMPRFMKNARPIRTQTIEKATAAKRHFTKSYLVLTKSCMINPCRESDTDRGRPFSRLVDEVEDHSRNEEGGEYRGEETDEQRHRESFDRPGAELEEEQ